MWTSLIVGHDDAQNPPLHYSHPGQFEVHIDDAQLGYTPRYLFRGGNIVISNVRNKLEPPLLILLLVCSFPI
jgi:hypothetical protein